MNKQRDTGYLFAKMSPSEDNGIGHIIINAEQKEKKSAIPPTRTYHFDENGKADEEQSFMKWIRENIMLLVTLMGVLVGVFTGAFLLINLLLISVYSIVESKTTRDVKFTQKTFPLKHSHEKSLCRHTCESQMNM